MSTALTIIVFLLGCANAASAVLLSDAIRESPTWKVIGAFGGNVIAALSCAVALATSA